MEDQWTSGHVVSGRAPLLLQGNVDSKSCLKFIMYTFAYSFDFFVCDRCDSVHLVGGLPSLLG